MDPEARQAWREDQWTEVLRRLLKKLRAKEREDRRASAPWKAVVAAQMKAMTDASNAWLAEQIAPSSPTFVSEKAGLARDRKLGAKAAALSIGCRRRDLILLNASSCLKNSFAPDR